MPLFSVIVPVYNHEQYVGQALDSLLAQTDKDWEAIVVNDGSTDATPRVVNAYTDRDPRIKVLHKANGGVSSALNAGIRMARGTWIGWLSSDDLYEPGRLSLLRDRIDQHPETKFFFSDFRTLDQATGAISDKPLLMPVPAAEWHLIEMLNGIFINGITMCVHRTALDAAGPFDEGMRYGQDYDMWLRLLAAYRAVYIPDRTCISRCHAGQQYSRQPFACLYDCAKAGIRFLNTHCFEELFPGMDLSDPATATRAFDRAMQIAASPYAYLHAMGPHPALTARIMEWLWSPGNERRHRRLRHEFGRRARAASFTMGGTLMGTVWKGAALAAEGARKGECSYQPVLPLDVACSQHGQLKRENQSEAVELRAYVKRFERHELPEAIRCPSSHGRDVLIVCAGDPRDRWVTGQAAGVPLGEVALAMRDAGHRVLVVGRGTARVHMHGGVTMAVSGSSMPLVWAMSSVQPADLALGVDSTPLLRGPVSFRRPIRLAEIGAVSAALDAAGRLPPYSVARRVQYAVLRVASRVRRAAARGFVSL